MSHSRFPRKFPPPLPLESLLFLVVMFPVARLLLFISESFLQNIRQHRPVLCVFLSQFLKVHLVIKKIRNSLFVPRIIFRKKEGIYQINGWSPKKRVNTLSAGYWTHCCFLSSRFPKKWSKYPKSAPKICQCMIHHPCWFAITSLQWKS